MVDRAPMGREEAIDYLALEFAKQRTHGNVFMDGSHNPRPSERRAAEWFIEALEYCGWTPAEHHGQHELEACADCREYTRPGSYDQD